MVQNSDVHCTNVLMLILWSIKKFSKFAKNDFHMCGASFEFLSTVSNRLLNAPIIKCLWPFENRTNFVWFLNGYSHLRTVCQGFQKVLVFRCPVFGCSLYTFQPLYLSYLETLYNKLPLYLKWYKFLYKNQPLKQLEFLINLPLQFIPLKRWCLLCHTEGSERQQIQSRRKIEPNPEASLIIVKAASKLLMWF
jgi:hypothetical protein